MNQRPNRAASPSKRRSGDPSRAASGGRARRHTSRSECGASRRERGALDASGGAAHASRAGGVREGCAAALDVLAKGRFARGSKGAATAGAKAGASASAEASANAGASAEKSAVPAPPCSSSNLNPEDYVASINFDKCRDLVGFCDLSRTSPTGFKTQTLLTEFGLTCHARRVRAHWRESLASIGFVRITFRRATSNPRQPRVLSRMASLEDTSSLARSTSAPLTTNALPALSGERARRKTLTEDVRWLLRGSISKKADGGCTSSSSGRSSRSA
jgi:hypothetical protein